MIYTNCVPESPFVLYNFFNLFLSVFGGFFLAFAFTSHLIEYSKNTDTDDSDASSDDDSEDLLEDKYYEELNALDMRVLTKEELDTLQSKVVEVETPDGLVKMTYNNSTESFWYYTNNKSVHYKYLDAVARHFTIENNCRQICVNYKEEYEKGVATIKEQEQQQQQQQKQEQENKKIEDEKHISNNYDKIDNLNTKKSVFAKFKNYKVDVKNDEKKQSKGKNVYVLTDKANQFRFSGSLSDYDEKIKKSTCQKDGDGEIPSMDYATFKKLCINNNRSNDCV
jgi:hypothetical protein